MEGELAAGRMAAGLQLTFGRPLIGAQTYGGVPPFPPPNARGRPHFSAYAAPSAFGPFQPYQPYPSTPVAPPRGRLALISLIALLVIALVGVGAVGAASVVRRLTAVSVRTPSATAPVPANPDSVAQTIAAAQTLLAARSRAVLARDEAAFLAGVDSAKPAFVERQKQLFASLIALPLATVKWSVRPNSTYNRPTLATSYAAPVFVTDVEFDYQLDGYDPAPVANAETLTFVRRPIGWTVGSDTDLDNLLPEGGHSEPWDLGPIDVVKGEHVLVIGAPQDHAELPELARVADAAAIAVAARWSNGWSHKVVVYAPRNRQVIATYFRSDLQSVDAAAAVQIEVFGAVPEWTDTARAVSSRVIFNPAYTRAGDSDLPSLLRHEFTHVATRSVTDQATPTWLVEGYAEYSGFLGVPGDRGVSPDVADAAAEGKFLSYLPSSIDFYSDPANYDRSWLLCLYIADTYGADKLKALYGYPASTKLTDPGEAASQGFRLVLGISQEQLLKDVNAWATNAVPNY